VGRVVLGMVAGDFPGGRIEGGDEETAVAVGFGV